MRSWLVVLFALLCPPVLAQQPQMLPVIRFDSVPDPLKLPADLYFGEVTGIAVNSKGHIFVFSRGNTTGRRTPRPRRNSGIRAQTANSSARSAITSTPGPSRTR